ncbi:MAG: hypothetical protein QM674_19155 [Burkholderiaceae bacterium]
MQTAERSIRGAEAGARVSPSPAERRIREDLAAANRLACAPDDPYAREWRALLQRLEPPVPSSFRD